MIILQLLREMRFAADRQPGTPIEQPVRRGMVLRVTRREPGCYVLECGHKKNYALESEVGLIAINWPRNVQGSVIFERLPSEGADPMRWLRATLTEVTE